MSKGQTKSKPKGPADFVIRAEEPPKTRSNVSWAERIRTVETLPKNTWYCIGEWANQASSYGYKTSLKAKYPHIEFDAWGSKEKRISSLYARVKTNA